MYPKGPTTKKGYRSCTVPKKCPFIKNVSNRLTSILTYTHIHTYRLNGYRILLTVVFRFMNSAVNIELVRNTSITSVHWCTNTGKHKWNFLFPSTLGMKGAKWVSRTRARSMSNPELTRGTQNSSRDCYNPSTGPDAPFAYIWAFATVFRHAIISREPSLNGHQLDWVRNRLRSIASVIMIVTALKLSFFSDVLKLRSTTSFCYTSIREIIPSIKPFLTIYFLLISLIANLHRLTNRRS